MGSTVKYGFPWPAGTELVKLGDDAIRSLAEGVEASLLSVESDVTTRAKKSDLPGNVMSYGIGGTETAVAVGDDTSHPLSEVYGSLGAAQADFPFVTALTQQRDWAAWQKLINDYMAANAIVAGGEVFGPPRKWYIGADSIQMPASVPNTFFSTLVINGGSGQFRGTGAVPIFNRDVTAFTTKADAAAAQARLRFEFKDVRLLGNNTVGQVGIRLTAIYSAKFTRCLFWNLDGGSDLYWALNVEFEQCHGNGIDTYLHRHRGAVARLTEIGHTWTDSPTVAGTASTNIVYRKTRSDCKAGQFTTFWIDGTYSTKIEGVIFEGNNPQYDIYAPDRAGQQTQLHIHDIHVEHTPTTAAIRAVVRNEFLLDGFNTGSLAAGCILVDGSGASATAVYRVINMPFFPTGAKFRHGSVDAFTYAWVFERIGTGGAPTDMRAAGSWDTAAAPVSTATTVNGSPNLTLVTPTTGWVDGMVVTGTGIPAGTRIRSGAGTATIIMENAAGVLVNATASASGVTITGAAQNKPFWTYQDRLGSPAEAGGNYPLAGGAAFRWVAVAESDLRLLTPVGVRIGDAAATPIKNHLSGTATWDPTSTIDGAMTSTTVTVTGAAVGDTVAVGFSIAVPAGCILSGSVTAANTVTVTLFNKSGAPQDLASGTLRADIWKH
jgi:hypothetical protein